MTQKDSRKNFVAYMKSHNIPFIEDSDDGFKRYTMRYREDNVPDGDVESCIWFYEDITEVRVYYNAAGAEICRNSKYIDRLLQLLNYINARVFLSCGDTYGLYR